MIYEDIPSIMTYNDDLGSGGVLMAADVEV